MTPKVFSALGAVAAISLITAGAANSVLSDRSSDMVGSGVLIPSLIDVVNDAAKLVVTQEGVTLTIARTNQGWNLPDKGGYPADPAKVRANIVGLAELQLVEPKTRKSEFYERLQVEDPDLDGARSRLFEIFDADGAALASVIVGRRKKDVEARGKPGVYVRLDGEDRAWLAGGDINISTSLSDWLDSKLTDLVFDDIKTMTISRPNTPELKLTVGAKDQREFNLEDVPDGWEAKPPFALGRIVARVLKVEFDDMRPAEEVGEPVVVTSLDTKNGLRVTIRLYRQGDQSWTEVDGFGDGEAAALARAFNDRFGGWQFGLSKEDADDLTVSHADVLKTDKDG